MLLRNGKILGELDVSFCPRLQHALSIAKQNKTSGAFVLLTPDHQHKERETTHNTISPDEGIENRKEALSKFDEVQEKSNSIVETPVRSKTSKVTVQDPSTGTVASKTQQTYQLWGNPIFSNVNKNSTTVTAALRGAWGGPVSTTSQSSTAVQIDNLFSNLTIVNNDMNKPFILTCDASKSAIGYILSQLGDDNKEHVISYNGRSLRPSEKNYGITKLECLSENIIMFTSKVNLLK